MISEDNVVYILKKAKKTGVEVLVAGGWGVDALLGRQTRSHNDFDIFVQKKDETAMMEIFELCGYKETQKHSMDNAYWQNSDEHIIDFHLYDFIDAETMCIDNISFPADIFDGTGTIGGVSVRCMTADSQISYRHGYEPREKDAQDVLLLCATFGLPIPEDFKVNENRKNYGE